MLRRQYDLAMSLALELYVRLKFDDAMKHCDNLLEVHRRAGSRGPGGARIEASVNRAVIVIAIATWQAVVEDMARFTWEWNVPKPADPNYPFALLLKGHFTDQLDRFSTPNPENTRKLLQLVGFDPRPYWTWTTTGGRGKGVTLAPKEVEARLRDWLSVRHAIAHGNELPNVDVLEAVRQEKPRTRGRTRVPWDGGLNVRLVDARHCIAFVRKLAHVTLNGLGDELDAHSPTGRSLGPARPVSSSMTSARM